MSPQTARYTEDLWESEYVLDTLRNSQSRTPRDALDRLRNRHPPRDVQISRPTDQAQDALRAITSLAYALKFAPQSTELQIAASWTKVISPWVEFFLQEVILVEEWPQTLEGVEFLEKSLRIVPLLFEQFLYDDESDALDNIREITPYLVPLIAKAWIKVIDRDHPSLSTWSDVVNALTLSDDMTPPKNIPKRSEHTELWIRHVLRESTRIKSEPFEDMRTFSTFIIMHRKTTLFNRGQHGYIQSVVKNSISTHVHLLAALLTKRKSVRDTALGSEECLTAHALAVTITNFIRGAMERLPQILEAVRAGFFVALLKSYTIYFRCDGDPNIHTTLTHGEETTKITFYVTKFLVYPSVLHAFFRVTVGIRGSIAFEAGLRERYGKLPDAWGRMERKARSLHSIRTAFREAGRLSKCSFQQCDAPAARARYLRCCGCYGVVYCSSTCQKLHWNKGHREECGKIANSLKEGTILSDEDSHFFEELTRFYVLERFPRRINELAMNCASSPDVNQVKRRNCIVVLDFGLVDLPAEQDLSCLDPLKFATQYQSRLGLEQTLAHVHRWKATDVNKVFVVSLFPKTQHQLWSFERTHSYPLVDTPRHSDLDIDVSDSDEGRYESGK
ncbi:hypothetical protein AAF712_010064 [Marasmius tenuissimus]|uniref:MYND-type domain-containing protein n=1 Tax=Marasmius tenuissimus TaxID=585030 RepID=A0ABR2ZP01_9AGAR